MVLVVKVIVSEIDEKVANVVYTGRVRNIYVNIYLYIGFYHFEVTHEGCMTKSK